MTIHIENRKRILHALAEELVGPSPQGDEIDCSGELHFASSEEFFRPYRQSGTGEEILQRDPPCKRYGVGVLYPRDSVMEDLGPGVPGGNSAALPDDSDRPDDGDEPEEEASDQSEITDQTPGRLGRDDNYGEAESNDLDMSSANRYRPSSMGLSFLVELPGGSRLEVEATGGRYEPKDVSYDSNGVRKAGRWWLRVPVSLKATFGAEQLNVSKSSKADPAKAENSANGPIDLRIEAFVRPQKNSKHKLVTVCIVNRCDPAVNVNEHSLFQCHLRASVVSEDGGSHILPYPGVPHERMDEEEKSLSLIYRDCEAFAIGHGCAADWTRADGSQRAQCVTAECLPRVELPSTSADVRRPDGSTLGISMRTLAGLDSESDGLSELAELIDLYEGWISRQKAAIEPLEEKHRPAARTNIELCRQCVERMKKGLSFLASDDRARKAFQLANHAILLQQVRASRDPRSASYDSDSKRIKFSRPYLEADLQDVPKGSSNWRAFQAAFLLASICSAADGDDRDRDVVELIWFPTGGGKTEAYLGLAAFSIFMRRLEDPNDSGVQVIMRYTLRLLTAQQFQRASALICAMEYLRDPEDGLGTVPFSIGIWLGSENTPNKRSEARAALKKMNKDGIRAQNPFVITKCPWCGAEMGPVKAKMPKDCRVLGYVRSGDTVAFQCSDRMCHFSSSLPIYVVDEDVYEKRPSIIIGTVDKFAALAWLSEPRALFGLAADGSRSCSPPGLVIQDELHLISGPLGSMVGLYEPVLEELCTDRRNGVVHPKIVSSTATIRRYEEQIRSLYGRSGVALFPPPGLSAADTFFSSYARDPESGELLPGKVYVGVHAPGLGSMQTVEVRAFTALLQSPMILPAEERDPWWTLLLFFNSLRELGTTLSLFQSDIPNRFGALKNRMGLDRDGIRKVRNELELTSRLRNDEVPRAIEKLEKTCGTIGTRAIDACLASSIIEVGIDIKRLSLMAVVGQPKSTSQYIQVTGRIGRNWKERPGIVVTLFGASKPRDRSHFEQFRSYHERLYAQVEPTSVTPFSRPSLERALHGVMVSYVRQTGGSEESRSPYPAPDGLLASFKDLIMNRAAEVDPEEVSTVEQVFGKRRQQWENWQRTEWSGPPRSENAPLMVRAGAYVPQTWRHVTWETPNSMRNVDAECRIAITQTYLLEELPD